MTDSWANWRRVESGSLSLNRQVLKQGLLLTKYENTYKVCRGLGRSTKLLCLIIARHLHITDGQLKG